MNVKSRYCFGITFLAATIISFGCSDSGNKPAPAANGQQLSAQESAKIAVHAIVYGLPLVVADLTMRLNSNVARSEPNAHASINQFGNMAKYPTASGKDIVRMNVDTLYSFAVLDLSKEPSILSGVDSWSLAHLLARPVQRASGKSRLNCRERPLVWSV